MQLSDHFSLEELIASQTAIRLGIDNTPSPEIVANLKLLAAGLEDVRRLLGYPIHVDSGYRCPALNKAVRGSKNSMHMQGLAADIICPQFGTPLEVCRAIAKSITFYDQLIHEGNWAHFGLTSPKDEPRRDLLTARFTDGGVIYEPGLLQG